MSGVDDVATLQVTDGLGVLGVVGVHKRWHAMVLVKVRRRLTGTSCVLHPLRQLPPEPAGRTVRRGRRAG